MTREEYEVVYAPGDRVTDVGGCLGHGVVVSDEGRHVLVQWADGRKLNIGKYWLRRI